jgi:hypothetical protein
MRGELSGVTRAGQARDKARQFIVSLNIKNEAATVGVTAHFQQANPEIHTWSGTICPHPI